MADEKQQSSEMPGSEQPGNEKPSNEKPSKKGGKAVIYAGGAVIAVLTAVVVFLLLRDNSEEVSETVARRAAVINESNMAAVAESMAEYVAPGSYEVTMNSTWRFADGKSASENAYVENAQGNTNDVYFDVHRSDTEELIYSSPLIPRGNYLDNIKLDTELPGGTYDCVLTYHLVDEDQRTLSTLKINLAIEIAQ